MSTRLSMLGMLWVALGITLALALINPSLIPQIEFDSIPLIKSNAIYSLLVSAIVLLPFVVALVCSGEGRRDREREIARGIAVGSGGVAVVILALLSLVVLYGLAWGGSGSALWAMRLFACLVLLVVNALLVWTALRGPSGSLTAISGLAIVSVAVYAALVFVVFQRADQVAQRKARAYRQRMDVDSQAAESAVRSVTYCAIGYLVADPGREIPGDLESLVRVAGCDPQLLDRGTTPEYNLSFSTTPLSQSPAGTARDCQVIATFAGDRLPDGQGGRFSDGRRFSGDCSGIIREREQRYEVSGRDLVVGFDPSTAFNTLVLEIEHFSEAKHRYPATLAELREKIVAGPRGASDYLSNQAPADLSQNIIRWGWHVFRYVPDRAGGIATPIENFHIDARCEAYSPKCMRSYLLDDQGFVHGTGQNREATESDPIVESCELRVESRSCDGKPSESIRRAGAMR